MVPPSKPPYPVMDYDDSKTNRPKIRVDTWMKMNVFPLEYGIFTRNSTGKYGSFILLLTVSSIGNIVFVELLLCWCGFFFGQN